MATFQVSLKPDGKSDWTPYQQVEAATAKEAAEKLYGRPLNEVGPNDKIRARVRPMRGKTIVFYEV